MAERSNEGQKCQSNHHFHFFASYALLRTVGLYLAKHEENSIYKSLLINQPAVDME
jgi:hypothetical protein